MLALDSGHTIGDIAAPVLIDRLWPGRVQSIVGQRFGRIPALGHLPIDARHTRLHAPFPHQAGHPVLADLNALSSQRLIHTRAAITTATCVIGATDLEQQIGVL